MSEPIRDPNVEATLRAIGATNGKVLGHLPQPEAGPVLEAVQTVGVPITVTRNGQEVVVPVEVAQLWMGEAVLAELRKLNETLAPFVQKFGGGGLLGRKGK